MRRSARTCRSAVASADQCADGRGSSACVAIRACGRMAVLRSVQELHSTAAAMCDFRSVGASASCSRRTATSSKPRACTTNSANDGGIGLRCVGSSVEVERADHQSSRGSASSGGSAAACRDRESRRVTRRGARASPRTGGARSAWKRGGEAASTRPGSRSEEVSRRQPGSDRTRAHGSRDEDQVWCPSLFTIQPTSAKARATRRGRCRCRSPYAGQAGRRGRAGRRAGASLISSREPRKRSSNSA